MVACGSTFSATSRLSFVSVARQAHTHAAFADLGGDSIHFAHAPSPILAVTEYGPRAVPGCTGISPVECAETILGTDWPIQARACDPNTAVGQPGSGFLKVRGPTLTSRRPARRPVRH